MFEPWYNLAVITQWPSPTGIVRLGSDASDGQADGPRGSFYWPEGRDSATAPIAWLENQESPPCSHINGHQSGMHSKQNDR